MSFVRGDHQTRVVVLVGLVYVRAVSHQVLHYVQPAVEAGGAEGRAQSPSGVVHVSPGSH